MPIQNFYFSETKEIRSQQTTNTAGLLKLLNLVKSNLYINIYIIKKDTGYPIYRYLSAGKRENIAQSTGLNSPFRPQKARRDLVYLYAHIPLYFVKPWK